MTSLSSTTTSNNNNNNNNKEGGESSSSTDTTTGRCCSLTVRDIECNYYTWNVQPADSDSLPPKALVIVYHGFCAHGNYPTVRYACELLASSNYAVIAPDLPGHGKSGGLRGYLPSAETMIEDGIAFANHACRMYNNNNPQNKNEEKKKKKKSHLKVFMIGSSMGGTIALSVAQRFKQQQQQQQGEKEEEEKDTTVLVSGVLLLAPMLKLNVNMVSRMLLSGLSMIIPMAQIIPTNSNSSEKQYRDVKKRKECDDDDLSVDTGGSLYVASALTCVEMACQIQSQFEQIQIPLLLMVADEDVIVDNQGSMDLYQQSTSNDKTLKRYPALHGLLCEPSPLIDQIHTDLLQWMEARI